MEKRFDVFISYSTEDQKIAEGVCGYLESNGYRCFVAYRDIPRGIVWAAAITEAIDESAMMVVVFSKYFNISPQTDREIELASENKMPILTYRIADDKMTGAKKYYLKNLNWIDAFPNPENYFGRLLESVVKLIGPKTVSNSNEKKGDDVPSLPEGAVGGVFSVSPTKKVFFSKGNLQYLSSKNMWRFADKQYDYLGVDNNVGLAQFERKDLIDLFGWGTGYSPEDYTAEAGQYTSFVDWGCHPIKNGGNQSYLWYTLSKKEWVYVFEKRKTKSGIRFAKARVNNIDGVLLFPDKWKFSIDHRHRDCSFAKRYLPILGNEKIDSRYYNNIINDIIDFDEIKNVNETDVSFANNTISKARWDVLEELGVVFLPVAGTRVGNLISQDGISGFYWSATYNNSKDAYCVYFDIGNCNPSKIVSRYHGQSVRLVCSAAEEDFIMSNEAAIRHAIKHVIWPRIKESTEEDIWIQY